MTDIHETKEWKEMVARVERRVAAEGGSTGSNMAEPLYFEPGAARIPDGLPPEEVARRQRAASDIDKVLKSIKS